MPFGLCNAPGTFQRLMQRLFGDQQNQSLLLYLDDIVVFSSTVQQHLDRLEVVLCRLQRENLKAKFTKCAFFQEEVRYLGHVISSKGVATDPSKVEVVANWQPPTTVSELRSFLGFASYYRRFVEGFAKLAAPLHKLVAHLGAAKSKRQADPCIREVLGFWRRKQRPNAEERQGLTQPALVLLRQWDRLEERSGVLYRRVFRPDGAEVVLQVLFSYNTTPHQATGESPFFLMFGQEPRLPVDFLLGRVQDPVGGNVHEWIQEHQTRLQLAFEGATERLRVAAQRRKHNHDRRVRDVPFKLGQLVWLRDFSARGRHKLRDLYGPVQYRVLRVPREEGSVYTIAPVDEPTKVKQVNRALLKAVVVGSPSGGAASPCSPPADQPLLEDESIEEDLLVWRHDAPLATPTQVSDSQRSTRAQFLPVIPVSIRQDLLVPPINSAAEGSSAPPVPLPRAAPAVSEVAIRRTARSTAGQHSNVYHLPRPLASTGNAADPSGPGSNAITALFRPWN
ncbi:thy-1 membrane glycoprotein [Pimephales promelas]|nr:thy-1 membrane glycoprotein [Pimephales promelas]KAG1955425.1 thy-1 membrane glycoprotein [Pimephales promelas]KAG1955426.1 thy-1 membrane glycoprotein [Pimephales promelas]KAG1955427.1 thy-1 membrane glycoprotein [Pimephales promelas]KAG1955428.1 thy-1 membrane glycoprotein [Pimephales promelas]